jgi:hypothetical protein
MDDADWPDVLTMDFKGLCGEFAKAELRERELEESLKSVARRKAAVKTLLLKHMQGAGGVQSLTTQGLTIYLHRQLWAKLKEIEPGSAGDAAKTRANAALRAAGLDHLVYETFNSNSVSAYMRNELPKDANDMPALPPELAQAFEVAEVFDVRAIAAAKRTKDAPAQEPA